jgi:chemosensory pili system protein ChpA (sensor histidine kinase/response regulator)
MLEVTLRGQNYDVALAADGLEGLAVIKKTMPDLAILDVKMPRLNGFELLMEMRKSEQLKSIPVLMLTSLTAGSGKSDELWRDSLEITDFLSKPFEGQELLRRVNRILQPQEQ